MNGFYLFFLLPLAFSCKPRNASGSLYDTADDPGQTANSGASQILSSERKKLSAVDFRGKTVTLDPKEPGYFEVVNSGISEGTEYWLSDIQLFSAGGGADEDIISPFCGACDPGTPMAPPIQTGKLWNDIIGLKIRTYAMKPGASQETQSNPPDVASDAANQGNSSSSKSSCNDAQVVELKVGPQDTKKNSKVLDFNKSTENENNPDCSTYLSMVEYKALELPKKPIGTKEFYETLGFAALRFSLSSPRINTQTKIVEWDVSDPKNNARTYRTQFMDDSWPMRDEKKWVKFPIEEGYAVTGFYGKTKEIKNHKGKTLTAIESLGVIVAPIACALEHQKFNEEDIREFMLGRFKFQIKNSDGEGDKGVTYITCGEGKVPSISSCSWKKGEDQSCIPYRK